MDDRLNEMDKMWLLEKDQELFLEWQMIMEEEEKRKPAIIQVLTPYPKLKEHEIHPHGFPFQ